MKKIIFSLLFILSASAFGQSFSVFDIDTTNFPTMKANFWAFDAADKQLNNFSPYDFEVKENGKIRTVTSVNCPGTKPVVALSSVLAMDVSSSMSLGGLELAKSASNTWINYLNLGPSECALLSFSDQSYINRDFTTNKNNLINGINSLQTIGGTNYDAAFLNPYAGALAIAQNGKHKRIIVFLSDGQPNLEPHTSEIIKQANNNNITIYCLTIGFNAPECMKEFAKQTGGLSFENIQNKEQVIDCYRKILTIAQGGEPCKIEWQSEVPCVAAMINVSIKALTLNIVQNEQYTHSLIQNTKLEYTPTGLIFYNSTPGIKRDTIVKLTARNSDIKITNINSSHPAFSFDKTSFFIPKNQSVDLKIIYFPNDSNYVYTKISFETDVCPFEMSTVAYFKAKKTSVKTIKLTKPNGGETFLVGSDNVISWEAIPETDQVSLDYSIDDGKNWKKIKDKTPGLSYNWLNTPPPISDKCLVRVTEGASDSLSQIEWQKCLGGSDDDVANSIQQTLDGGFILAGYTESTDGDIFRNHRVDDAWVVKINSTGLIEWEKCFGGNDDDVANSIQLTLDGGFILAGYTKSTDGDVSKNHGKNDVWVVKINSTGVIEWEKCFGGNNDDVANSIQQTLDGGFILAGYTKSYDGDISENHGEIDAWIVKLTSTGTIEWEKCLGESIFDYANSILQTIDEGYIIAGSTMANKSENDAWVVKLNPLGVIEWQKYLGGYYSEKAYALQTTSDGGFVVAGYTNSRDGDFSDIHGGYDALVVKLNSSGVIEWQKCLGGTSDDYANSIQQTLDGGFIVAGYTNSNDGDVSGNHGDSDVWVVKLSADGGIIQQDESDAVFSIVEPKASAISVDMGKCLVSMSKDSVVTQFTQNIGSYKCRIDSIYIQGADAGAFKLIGGFPNYEIDKAGAHFAEFNFKPSRIGVHNAEIVVVTQSETLKVPITGEGVAMQLQIMSGVLDFGMVEVGNEKTFTDTVIVKNINTAPISISKIVKMSPDLEQFDILSGGDPVVLNARETHKMTVRFMPKFGCRTSGRIGFEYNGTGSPITATLFGTGIGGVVVSSSDSAYSGEKRNINITLKNIKPAGLQAMAKSFSANLKFQGRILAPQDFSQVLSFKNDSITMRVSGDLPNDNIIYTIPMIAGLGNVEETSIEISDFKLYDNTGAVIDYDMEVEYGAFKVLGICREGGTRLVNPNAQAQILSVRPNPATNAINIEYQLTEKGGAEFLLINDLGETVKQINYGEISDYSQRLETIKLDELANGRYTLILKTPTISERRSVVVVK